jgi:hypothetical protein
MKRKLITETETIATETAPPSVRKAVRELRQLADELFRRREFESEWGEQPPDT